MVFGDEYNDIAMLKCVPYSFAMSTCQRSRCQNRQRPMKRRELKTVLKKADHERTERLRR